MTELTLACQAAHKKSSILTRCCSVSEIDPVELIRGKLAATTGTSNSRIGSLSGVLMLLPHSTDDQSLGNPRTDRYREKQRQVVLLRVGQIHASADANDDAGARDQLRLSAICTCRHLRRFKAPLTLRSSAGRSASRHVIRPMKSACGRVLANSQ